MKNIAAGTLALSLAACLVNACSSVPDDQLFPCKPDAIIPDTRCISHDAGTDGDAEPTKQPTDVGDLGLDPAAWYLCGDGFCAPELSGQSALVWDRIPVSLYVGPNDGTPLACPDNLTEVGRFFDELVAPPAACDACTCEASKGECSQPPDKIEIRAGTCAESGMPFSPFDGPPNWTGTCSSEGGLSAGVMCGNEPCAQSVWASPLPPPKGDACMPTTSIPLSTKEFTWKTRGIACEAKTEQGACSSETQYCAADLGLEWLTCVHQKGLHNLSDCPDMYNASVHRLYPDEPIDDRGCTECSCGTPVASACIGYLRTYRDDACSQEGATLQVGSMGENCTNLIPAGQAVDSKRVTDLAYLPGTCGPTGGEPKGVATGDAANAVTFCCMKPLPPKPSQTMPG